MPSSLVVEVGKISLVQAGLLGPINEPLRFDRNRMVLLVLNDPVDVRYEIGTSIGTTVIKPSEEPEDCCLIAAPAGTLSSRVEELCPRRVIGGHVAHGYTWPREWFQSAGAGAPDGPYRTTFGLIADDFAWSWRLDQGNATYTFELPANLRVFKATRGAAGDLCSAILGSETIERISLMRAGVAQQTNGGEPWPP